ncbi:MAG: alpha/beta fold hydrolase [Gemmatimonadetes bacterium]|nr:alpha/beta fold hydrolase [Gemmatimonadota bacterium]
MISNRFLPALVTAGMAAVMVAAPATAHGQVLDRGAFVMRVAGDTIAVERFSREPGHVDGELTIAGRARSVYTMRTGGDGTVSGLEIRTWAAGSADSLPPLQAATVTPAGDSAVVAMQGHAQQVTQTVHGARGALPLVNPSAVMMEQVFLRARALGGDSAIIPIYAIGITQSIPARVRWIGADSAVLAVAGVEVRAHTDASGRMLGAAVASQRLQIDRVASATVGFAPPDYSAPAGAPYTAEEVRVPHPSGFRLAGTLTIPADRHGRIPAVVMITGSGLEDRDEAIPGVHGYRPFRDIADTLGRRGIAVLRMDDRSFGGSGGDAERATSQDFAGDIAAAVAYLRTRPDIDPDRIAVVGHSEGGIIAPMVAVADPRLRAAVLIAGTSRTGRRVIDYQLRNPLQRDTTLTPARRDSAVAAEWRAIDAQAGRTPWWRFFLDYDPLTTARRVRQPVLILQGATDQQVTADQAPELAAAIRAAGNHDVTLRVIPDMDHLMLHDPSGMPAGYASLPSKKVSPELLGTLADWLVAKLR